MGSPHKTPGKNDHLQTKERDPQKKPALPTPCSWASGLQNCEETELPCLSHLIYDPLLWKP